MILPPEALPLLEARAPTFTQPTYRRFSLLLAAASSTPWWSGGWTAGAGRWPDLMVTLQELTELGVGFVSLTEALDLTTPTGRAMAGMLAVFAEFEREVLRERVRAGIAQARREGRPHGRPRTASLKAEEVLRLKAERVSHSEIARRLGIGRTSVRRILAAG